MGSNNIVPTADSMYIGIFLGDMKKFTEMFKKKSVYDFYVWDKKVYRQEVFFLVRSMRVNEFVDMLDEKKIKWRDLKPGEIKW